MDQKLQAVTDAFIAIINSDETIQTFQKANRAFEENRELQDLRARYGLLSQQLQSKQMDGTLTQEDISELRTLQNQVNTHPLTAELLRTQENATAILNECNLTISEILGFNFAAAAAPASACR